MATSTSLREKPRGPKPRPGGAFSNGIKPGHVILMVLFLLLRNGLTFGSVESGGASDGSAAHREGEEGGGHEGEEEHHGYQVFHVDFDYVQVPFIISLWIFVSSLAKVGFHMTPVLHNIFPESCLLIVVGIVIGFLLILTSDEVPTTLTPTLFFIYMLPPIIFDAGYFMPNRLFFDHLGTILLMAVVGTIFNMLTVGVSLWAVSLTGLFGEDPPTVLETFLFASLIVAVDPVAVLAVFEEIHVDEILYIVVFGESLLNDAVTVVLYHMFEAYVEIGQDNIVYQDVLKGLASFLVVALGGVGIGIIWGYLTGFVTRFTNHARVLEPLFVFVMAYMSYLNAELFHMSGILAITFCGITMKNYVERNISSKSQTTLKYALKMLSGSSETIIFMFLGVATIHDDHEWNWAFVCLTILFCTIYRIMGVLLLVAIANRYRLHKLKAVDQFVMMYGGLRGAVAFALALLIDKRVVPHAPMFVTTTIAMIYWTVFVQGITIKPLVKFLNVKTASGEKDPSMNERIAGRFMDHVVAGMEGILGELGKLRMRDYYKYVDTKYIKPCLLRENQYRDPKIIETFENLTNKDAIEFMKRNPTQFAGLKSMADMSFMDGMRSQANLAGLASQANLENFDMKEMAYVPSQKDLSDARIHHMLSENLFMPRARPRKMSYSRHAMKEEDLTLNHDVNYKVHMHVRRMMSENRAARRRKQARRQQLDNVNNANNNDKKGGYDNFAYEGDNHTSKVTFEVESPGMRVSGSSKLLKDDLIHEVIKEHEDSIQSSDDEGGLTFTPHPHVTQTLSGASNSPMLSSKHKKLLQAKSSNSPVLNRRVGILVNNNNNNSNIYNSGSQESTPVSTPWLIRGGLSNPEYVRELYVNRSRSYDSDSSEDDDLENRVAATQKVLPWKRNEAEAEVLCLAPVKQREFPPWIKNEDYMVHGTPAEHIIRGPTAAADHEAEHHSDDAEFEAAAEKAIAARRGSRRHSEAEFQERPPMQFVDQIKKRMKSQTSRSSVIEKVVNEEDEISRF